MPAQRFQAILQRHKTFFLCALILLSHIHAAHGQLYNFRNYSIENGLPQSYVQNIIQDNNGYLWLATADGLSRFDGQKFTNYTTKDGLAENWITAMAGDKNGNIWLGHQSGRISIYDMKADSFMVFDQKNCFSPNRINTIFEDREGRIWVGKRDKGVLLIEGSAIRSFLKTDGLSDSSVFSICQDQAGRIWFATLNGLSIYAAGSFSTIYGLPSSQIFAILEDYRGNIWMGTREGVMQIPSAFAKSGDSTRIKNNIKVFRGPNAPPATDISFTLTEDSKENIWIGTYTSGVYRYNNTTQEFRKYNHTNGLANDNIYKILEDREGNIWIGTLGGGVAELRYNDERFEMYTTKDSLPNNQIWSVLNDRSGNIWIATQAGLVQATPSASGILTKFRIFAEQEGLRKAVVLSVFEDSKGTLWAGLNSDGQSNNALYRMKPGEKKFEGVSFTTETVRSVSSITEDRKGNLWIATYAGVYCYNPESKAVRKYGTENGLRNEVVNCIYKDSKNVIWVCAEGGLTMIKGENVYTYGKRDGLEADAFFCITEDKEYNLWIGTQGHGMYRFDRKKFYNLSTKDGLSSDNIYSLLCDNRNNLWAGTSTGIDKYDQVQKNFRHYGKPEGFLGVETNLNAALKDRKGDLWFGTISGLVKYYPDRDVSNPVEPLTYIRNLKVFFKDKPFPAGGKFNYNENHLTFEFLALSLAIPENIQYQYKLEGLEKSDWSPPTKRTDVTFSNLDPGAYTLLVKASNNDGVWNSKPVVYSFEITPPFWKTKTFYALVVLCTLTGIYLFIRVRTRNLERAKKILEEQVRERTAEVVKQKEEIVVKNQKLEGAYSEIQKNRDEIALKNKDITDSITYAKRIQEAILPMKQEIRKAFTDSFVFFRPRDIVSGDFYWYAANSDVNLMAVVDCTGHGVPGAFMSIVGNSSLNEIVNEKNIVRPADVLIELDEKVTQTLRQSADESGTRDGMDIALCAVDFKKNRLEYAGANRPLYHIRNHELTEIKGNNFPIGGYFEEKKIFTNHTLDLCPGDIVYMCSDGYADQFGGPKAKKFMTKQLKKLLLEIHELPLAEQERLLHETLEKWRSGTEQIDDILVIGLRF